MSPRGGKPVVRGSFAALPTPFEAGRPERIDFEALRRLVERQVRAGSAGIVVCGTTGEAASLSDAEREAVVAYAAGVAGGRIAVGAGVGAPSTAKAARLAHVAQDAGADFLLAAAPPYVRPTQPGLEAHFAAVAAASTLPLVLYNVPSRAAVDLLPETAARIAAACDRVVAIKECAGLPGRVAEHGRRSGLPVLCGEDASILAALRAGAAGAIGVVANLVPEESTALVRLGSPASPDADPARADALQAELLPIAATLFSEPSPAPVKAALELLGLCSEELRLPLVPVRAETRRALEDLLAHPAGV